MKRTLLTLLFLSSTVLAAAQPGDLIRTIKEAKAVHEAAASMPALYAVAERLAALQDFPRGHAVYNWLGPYWAATILNNPRYQVPLDTLILNAEKTLAYLEQALALNTQQAPSDLTAIYMLQVNAYNRAAFATQRKGDAEQATVYRSQRDAALHKALALDPQHPHVLMYIGFNVMGDAQREDAERPLEKALAAQATMQRAVQIAAERYPSDEVVPSLPYSGLVPYGLDAVNALIARLMREGANKP